MYGQNTVAPPGNQAETEKTKTALKHRKAPVYSTTPGPRKKVAQTFLSAHHFTYDPNTLALTSENVIAHGETNTIARPQDHKGRPAGSQLGQDYTMDSGPETRNWMPERFSSTTSWYGAHSRPGTSAAFIRADNAGASSHSAHRTRNAMGVARAQSNWGSASVFRSQQTG